MDYRGRLKSVSKDVPEPSAHVRGKDYLLFRLIGRDFGIPASKIQHLVNQPSLFELSLEHPAFAGWLHLADLRFPALDLAAITGEGTWSSSGAAIIVELQPPSRPPVLTALLVEKLFYPATIADSQIAPSRPASGGQFGGMLAGVWRERSRPCYLIDLRKLAALPQVIETVESLAPFG